MQVNSLLKPLIDKLLPLVHGNQVRAETTEEPTSPVPTVWLLGKAGVGKSSLVNAITGQDLASIGEGWRPCTGQVEQHSFPEDTPVLRFLDTRGLGEAGYDPTADLDYCRAHCQAVIAVMRLDSPEQGAVLQALKDAPRKSELPMLLVLSHQDRVAPVELDGVVAAIEEKVREAWDKAFEAIVVDFPQQSGLDELRDALSRVLPEAALLMVDGGRGSAEQQAFHDLRAVVLAHAGTAALAGAVPVAGAMAALVPQANMLRVVANHHRVDWDSRNMLELFGALGSGFAMTFAGSTLARTVVSAVPGVGTAISATTSFAITWALGRVASLYLFRKSRDEPVSTDELRAAYAAAFRAAKERR